MGDSALWYVQLLNITCLVLFIIAPWQLSLRLQLKSLNFKSSNLISILPRKQNKMLLCPKHIK